MGRTVSTKHAVVIRELWYCFDLTVECRRHYAGEVSPLSDTLGRYSDFFALFGDFKGFVKFLTSGLGDYVFQSKYDSCTRSTTLIRQRCLPPWITIVSTCVALPISLRRGIVEFLWNTRTVIRNQLPRRLGNNQMMNLTKIDYAALNDRQKENYNFQKIAAILADYGFNCIRLSDDYMGADFLALHIDGTTVLKVQLKGRLNLENKYIGKELFVAFLEKKSPGLC